MAGPRPRSDVHPEGAHSAGAVLNTRHDVWDIHTNKDRWWVITGGTNLYSQEQFPNMDLATNLPYWSDAPHPPLQSNKSKSDVRIIPFGPVFKKMEEAGNTAVTLVALSSPGLSGRRCPMPRKLLELIGVALEAATWTEAPPQRANFRAWTEDSLQTSFYRATPTTKSVAVHSRLHLSLHGRFSIG